MGEVIIRGMLPKDLDQIVNIEKICFSLPWSKASFENELKNEYAYYQCAEESGKIAGYMGMWRIIDELIEMLNGYDEPVIFNGDGSVNYREKIDNNINRKAYFAPEIFNYLKASTLAFIASKMAVEGDTVAAKDFKPQYLRLSQAERNRK